MLLLRIALNFLAAGLFLVGLAYYWLDNRVHELVGTAMFALLILHNGFNRRWYAGLPRTVRRPRRPMGLALNLLLLATMLVLLVTSLMISRTVFVAWPLRGGITAKEIHILAAYWALLLVALHLGLHWSMIMTTVRRALGISASGPLRRAGLRLAAGIVAAYGLWSWSEMGISAKLVREISLDFWDFEEATLRFFVNLTAIVALCVAVAHYTSNGVGIVRKNRSMVW